MINVEAVVRRGVRVSVWEPCKNPKLIIGEEDKNKQENVAPLLTHHGMEGTGPLKGGG